MGRRILIFDDNIELLEVLTPLLEMQGFVVEVYNSVANAINALQNDRFEVIIFSHDSDNESGGLFLLQVDVYRVASGVKVVCYSSSTDERSLEFLTRIGIKVLTKPLSFEHLLEAIADDVRQGELGS